MGAMGTAARGQTLFSGETSALNETAGPFAFFSVSGNTVAMGEPSFGAADIIVPSDCVASKFLVSLSAAPASGSTRTFALRKNGNTSSVFSCTIDESATSCMVGNTANLVAGDTLAIRSSLSGVNGSASAANFALVCTKTS
jgi:hypothetical protein